MLLDKKVNVMKSSMPGEVVTAGACDWDGMPQVCFLLVFLPYTHTLISNVVVRHSFGMWGMPTTSRRAEV